MFDGLFNFIETAPLWLLIVCGVGLVIVFGFVIGLLAKLEYFWNYVVIPLVLFALVVFGAIFFIRNFM